MAGEKPVTVVGDGKLVLDTLPVGIAFIADRVITRANRQLERMLGYGPGELDGQSSRILYPSEELWREAGERYRLFRGGEVMDGEFKLRRKDGTALWCRAVGGMRRSARCARAKPCTATWWRPRTTSSGRWTPRAAGPTSARRRCAAFTTANRRTCLDTSSGSRWQRR